MPVLDRRGFVRTGAAAALAGAGGLLVIPRTQIAGSSDGVASVAPGPSPGFYAFPLRDFTITVLADGHFSLPAELFGANVSAERRSAYYASRLLPSDAIRLPANPVVIDTGRRRVLVDTGTGASGHPPPSTGRLAASLAAAGIAPAAIDVVIVTHAHGDHVGGLIEPETGRLRFPNAEVIFSDTEYALWTADDVTSRVPAWVVEWGILEGNRRVFDVLGDRVRTVPMDGEVMAGIRSVPTPGHTPGHIGVLVASGDEQLFIVGDAIANQHTHFDHPEWQMAVDQDPEQGVRTRQRLLDRLATDRVLVQGFHLPFPGVGHVVRDGRAYRWLAMA